FHQPLTVCSSSFQTLSAQESRYQMAHPRRRIAIALLFLLAATFFFARCVDGARSMQTSYLNKPPSVSTATAVSSGRLFGYLPRAKLIPPSGPSERHNDVGPESDGDELIRKP
uniref:Uncharacterized protein n=1 Tax=Oryza brachyantha TaxID=4533 RepID=J3M2V4_ORYBR